jgi:AraC-like DNA-binding protein
MDALSDVLKSIRLEGAVYINAEFTAPWCVRARFGLGSALARLAGAEHVLFFHFVTEGQGFTRLDTSDEIVPLAAGDLVLYPKEDMHLLGSDLSLPPVETASLHSSETEDGQFVELRHGGGGVVTRFICGYLACSRSVCRPLLDALPRLLRISVGDDAAARLFRELLREGVRESSEARPGAQSMLAKLSELMFVEALRRHVEQLPPGGRGWLAGVRDPQVGKALALLHGDPTEAWTVDKLARRVALSRSALGARFATLVGEAPMKYLVRWRLALAAQSLRAGRDSVLRVAERYGYESEAAFSRAFKREFGQPPAAWRRQRV